MAIYRSDQAQVTFQTEAAPGGYIELASTVVDGGGTSAINLPAGHQAGTRVLTVDSTAGITAGEYIQIGGAATDEQEVRVVEHVSGTTGLVLDAPTAFFHANNDAVQVVKSITETAADQYINLVPGVYETVDTPDPEMAIEGRYLLGTASKRNFFAAYSGQQSFSGSIGGFVLLNGKPLRYPIGRVNTTTTYVNLTMTDGDTPDFGALIDGAAKKGDLFVTISDSNMTNVGANVSTGEYLVFTGSTSIPGSTTFSNETTEVRKHVGAASATALRLDYPLQFDHADDEMVLRVMDSTGGTALAGTTVVPYTHSIRETVDLDSVTWHVHMRASDEDATKDFDRRYFGGKIGSLTLSAEESGMVTAGWDSVNFLGMIHNQKSRSLSVDSNVSGTYTNAIRAEIDNAVTAIPVDASANLLAGNLIRIDDEEMEVTSITASDAIAVIRAVRGTTAAAHLDNAVVTKVVAVPFYSPMQSITSGEVQFPATEPYYFSQGEVTLFGQTIARIRSFSLSITNNEEPRYYVTKQMGRRRGPTEIKEQRREYSLAVTLGLPDATAANTAQNTVFNELLLEGNYGSLGDFNRQGKQGFNVVLSLTRGNVVTGFEDKILITIPDDGAAGTGGNNQGAFIRTAPHNITEDNPFQVEADILFRNLKIDVQDAEHYYP